jgi:hypothetical protein
MTRLPSRTLRVALATIVLVLLAKSGKVVFSKSYGMADLEWSAPYSDHSIQYRFDDEAIHRSRHLAP